MIESPIAPSRIALSTARGKDWVKGKNANARIEWSSEPA